MNIEYLQSLKYKVKTDSFLSIKEFRFENFKTPVPTINISIILTSCKNFSKKASNPFDGVFVDRHFQCEECIYQQ